MPSLLTYGRDLGTGGYDAVRGFNGITARVIEGGRISLQSAFVVVD
jgi:MOSC domain-containing protein YiiM